MNQSFVLDSLNDFYTQWSSAQCLRLVMLRGHSGSIFNEIVKVLKKEKKGLKLLFLKHHQTAVMQARAPQVDGRLFWCYLKNQA